MRPEIEERLTRILTEQDDELQRSDDEFYEMMQAMGPRMPGQPHSKILTLPRVKELLAILEEDMVLIEPTLNFIKTKLAEINMAKLRLLYGEEELQAKLRAIQDADASTPASPSTI